eukprot:TRINITY_DN3849_c0_g1_i1.p2 TRINITY_DN3849_c0_g1~~TRINITY_DN3849_c0_g1_i1.p2  ORF type:complete len:86 (-),score=4.47 TRINITY_DN3849_c0_g1_i1:154-411(-)
MRSGDAPQFFTFAGIQDCKHVFHWLGEARGTGQRCNGHCKERDIGGVWDRYRQGELECQATENIFWEPLYIFIDMNGATSLAAQN